MKGNGEVSWCEVHGIIASVQEMERVREDVAILLNNVWHSAIIDFGCASSRNLWVKLKFLRVKVCVVVGCGPNEGDGEEYRLCILGNLNGWRGDRMRAGITGA